MLKSLTISFLLCISGIAVRAQVVMHPQVKQQSGDLDIKIERIEHTAKESVFSLVFPKQKQIDPLAKNFYLVENEANIPVLKTEKAASGTDSAILKLFFPRLKNTTGVVDLFEDKENGVYFKQVKVMNFSDVFLHPLSISAIKNPVSFDFSDNFSSIIVDKIKKNTYVKLEGMWNLQSSEDESPFLNYVMRGSKSSGARILVILRNTVTNDFDIYRQDGVLLGIKLGLGNGMMYMADADKGSKYSVDYMDSIIKVQNFDETPYAEGGTAPKGPAVLTFTKLGPDARMVADIIGSNTKHSLDISTNGFFISNDGYIVTDYLSVQQASSILVYTSANKTYSATVATSDKLNNLAILKITDPKFQSLKALPYEINGNSADLGADVFSVGCGKKAQSAEEIKLTEGYINGKTGPEDDVRMYQVSVPIAASSGAPLIDKDGNVIGITSGGPYAIKARYLIGLLDGLPKAPVLHNRIKTLPKTEKIKQVSDYAVLIKVK